MALYEVGTDDGNGTTIQLDEEVEGTHQGSDDFCFIKIGEPVSIKPGDDSKFDLERPPSQPLAVSERFGLLFVAHSTGFCVARTKDVLESAKEIEDKGSGLSIQELSVVDVPIGKVHILALSADSSTLAASIGGEIHLFSVNSLVSKVQKSSFSCSLNDSSCIKDMQWTKKMKNYYIVLSNCGKLYYGDGQGRISDLMDNVDAVEWSVKGNFVAVARKNILSILSSKFKQRLSMSLLFKSWIGDFDANCNVKVDSIRWVRSDCIILGCFQLTGDGKEENYHVQIITSKDGKITDPASKPIVLYFDDMFEGLIDDVVPFGSGPYLLLSYLDQCELAITANRKNTGQHIALFGWSLDKKNEAAVIDILRDTWLPRIELQGNDDDNLILGLCVDKVSSNETIKLELGGEEKEFSPYCILLCVTVEGKLIMFHVTCVTGTSVPAETLSVLSHEEEDSEEEDSPADVPSGHGLSKPTLQVGEQSVEHTVQGFQNEEIIKERNTRVDDIPVKNDLKFAAVDDSLTTTPFIDQISHKEAITENLEVRTIANSLKSKTDGQQKVPSERLNQDTDGQQSLLSGQQSRSLEQSFLKTSLEGPRPVSRDLSKPETQKLGVGPTIDSFLRKSSTDKSSLSIHMDSQKATGVGKELSRSIGSTSLQNAAQLWSSGNQSNPMTAEKGSSLSFSDFIHSNQADNSWSSIAHFPGGPVVVPSCSKDTVSQSTSVIPSGRTAHSGHSVSTGVGKIEPLPSIRNSQLPSQENFTLGKALNDKFHLNKENYRNPSLTGLLNSESKLSKQSGKLEEMTKELETLLECIEGAGGYRDACTVLQKSSVVALEEGVGTLSDRCRMFRSKMDMQLGEIQQLLDKTVQVLARKIYIEGLVKQAADNRYWDLWNRQKLSSELELKRQHVLKLNQDLTNQLIGLERHFNTLDLNKFGENSRVRMGRKGFPSRYGASRHVHSLHSLHNTMISQLATAEQLSECLSKQMAMLSVDSPVTKQNVKKELFETIGIPYNGSSLSSPDERKDGNTPSNKNLLISSCPGPIKDMSKRNQSSVVKNSEPETVRRRRDSLDQSLASFEPPKTTVKRMLLQEDRQKGNVNRSSLLMDKQHFNPSMLEGSAATDLKHFTISSTVYPSVYKGIQDTPIKQAPESPSTLFRWANDLPGSSHSIGLKSTMQVLPRNSFSPPTTHPVFQSSPTFGQSSARGSCDQIAERSGNGIAIIEKTDSLSINRSLSIQPSEIHLHQAPSVSIRSPAHSLPKKSSAMSKSNDKEIVFSKFNVGSVKHKAVTTGNSFVESGRNEYQFSHVSAVGPASIPSEKIFQCDTVRSESHPGEMTSSASTSFVPVLSSSSPVINSSEAPLSLPIPSTAPVSSFPASLGTLSTGSKAIVVANQTVSVSKLPVSSFPNLSSSSSFQITEKPILSSTPFMNLTSEPPQINPQPPMAKLNPKTDQNSTIQTSAPQPEPPSSTFSSKLKSSVPSTLASEPATNLQSRSQLTYNDMSNPASNDALSSEPEQPLAAHVLSSSALSTSGSATDGKDESSSVALTQEDEMEEEAPEASNMTEFTLGNLGGFGIGSTPNPTAAKPNPFGVTFSNAVATPTSSPFTSTVNNGELFRPASFNFQSPPQPSQLTNFGAFSGGFSTGTVQMSTGSGFGQPAQIGLGQQVLGVFGQSRQLGIGLPGSGAVSASGFGGSFVGTQSNGGFSNASTLGGFANIGSAVGGFAYLASTGGGFAGGGFAGAASTSGGFAAAAASASAGGGFSGASAGGGSGAFSNQQGSGGFSAFGGGTGGTGKPPSELITQIRK